MQCNITMSPCELWTVKSLAPELKVQNLTLAMKTVRMVLKKAGMCSWASSGHCEQRERQSLILLKSKLSTVHVVSRPIRSLMPTSTTFVCMNSLKDFCSTKARGSLETRLIASIKMLAFAAWISCWSSLPSTNSLISVVSLSIKRDAVDDKSWDRHKSWTSLNKRVAWRKVTRVQLSRPSRLCKSEILVAERDALPPFLRMSDSSVENQ